MATSADEVAAAEAVPTSDAAEETEKSTIIKRRTAKHDTESRPAEVSVVLDGYDPELTEMQTCLDDKSIRVAHESSRRQKAQQELSAALDEFIATARKRTKSA